MICEEINTTEIIEVKRCSKCGEYKVLSEFHSQNAAKGTRKSKCKKCTSEYTFKYNSYRRGSINERQRKYNKQNRADRNLKERVRYASDVVGMRERSRRYHAGNRDKHAARNLLRRLGRLVASPAWLTRADLYDIRLKYEDAWWITQLTGVVHHVDHIHALNGKGFNGLHVPWNLQVLTASENIEKCNKPPKEQLHLFWDID